MFLSKIKFSINEKEIMLKLNNQIIKRKNNYISLFEILSKVFDIKDIELYTKRDEKFIISFLMLKKNIKKKYGEGIQIKDIGLVVVEEFLKLYKIYLKLKNNKNKYKLITSNGWFILKKGSRLFNLLEVIANKLILEELRGKPKLTIKLAMRGIK